MLAFFYLPHISHGLCFLHISLPHDLCLPDIFLSHGLCLPDISIPHGLWEIDRNAIVWNCFDMEMDFIK